MDNDELLVLIKGLFDQNTDEIKQYVDQKINGQGALIESLQSDIKAVAESHDLLNRKVDEVKQDIDGVKSKIAVVKDYVIGVDAPKFIHSF